MELKAQDLDRIGKEKPFTVSGGASLNQVVYTAFGSKQRRDPYSYVAFANLNVGLYGWMVPLSFSFSNQGRSFQQPFNQYSAHPSYKSIHAHVGYVSASYSPYSVSGHNFLGAAVDYEPEGKLKLSALYGRFLKRVQYDSSTATIPSYERMGYGVKAQYMHKNNSLQLTMFHAQDRNASPLAPDSLGICPQENLVMSLGASTLLFSKFMLRGEVASSAISADINAMPESREQLVGKFSPLYTTRASTSFYNAWKANFDYQLQTLSIGLGYERVEPNYRTFGAYYFNNDLENITVNASTSLANGKLSLTSSVGVQRDNLDQTKVSTLKRSVGALNLNFAPSEKLAISGSYSSFQTFTNIQSQFQQVNSLSPYENIDTLNFTQISRSGTVSISCSPGTNADRKQSVNISASAQTATDTQSDVAQNSGAVFYNVNASYAINYLPQGTTINFSFNSGVNESAGNKSATLGPAVGGSRSFFEKKLKSSLSINYLKTLTEDSPSGQIVTARIGSNLKIGKSGSMNANITTLHRKGKSNASFLEMTCMVGYSHSFSIRDKSK